MTDAPTMHHLLWPVPDLQSALAFYVTGLGMSVSFRDGDRFASVRAGGVSLALVAGSEDITSGVPAPAYKVADLGLAVAAAEGAGAEIVAGIHPGPHELRAVIRDPSGHLVVLYQAAETVV
jgi:catechol 2,3-dioxygenase-like lactoylglutathione lyase family enzyme